MDKWKVNKVYNQFSTTNLDKRYEDGSFSKLVSNLVYKTTDLQI